MLQLYIHSILFKKSELVLSILKLTCKFSPYILCLKLLNVGTSDVEKEIRDDLLDVYIKRDVKDSYYELDFIPWL